MAEGTRLQRRFDPDAFFAQLERLGATVDGRVRAALLAAADRRPAEILAAVVERSAIAPKHVHRAYAETLGVPFVDMDWIRPNRDLMGLLTLQQWRRFRSFPLSRIDNTLEIALADPLDARLPLELEQQFGLWVSRMYAIPEQIDQYLALEEVDANQVQRRLASLGADELATIREQLSRGDTSGIVELAQQIIALAQKQRASDIHIEPLQQQARVRVRVDGNLSEILTVELRVAQALTGFVKVAAELDISERRLPQDGRLTADLGGYGLDMRVSTIPTVHGEKVVMRLLDDTVTSLQLETLELAPAIMAGYRQVMRAPHGLFVVNGPTGSGKTTTLYATLSELADPRLNITTIEDPVEFRIGGINQIQVRSKVGLGFPQVLRSVLRQDPDIILVGEIRDEETAQIAVQAALTGHFVLTTLHTNSAPEAVTRLVDMGVPAYLVAQALVGSLGQRLLRRLCQHCRQPTPLGANDCERLGFTGDKLPDLTVWEPVGCSACRGSGFSGRIAVHELFRLDDALRRRISRTEPVAAWLADAWQKGYRPLSFDALVKALDGQTTISEVIKVHAEGSV